MVKVVEQWSGNHKVVGSTPSQVNFDGSILKIFFFHSHKNIHKISPAVVEACLKNSLLQYTVDQSKETP